MMTPANTKPILEWHVSLSGICSVAKMFVFKIKFVFLSRNSEEIFIVDSRFVREHVVSS